MERTGARGDDWCTVPSAPSMRSLAFAGTVLGVTAAGAALATLDRNPFWLLVAVWTMALVFSISAQGRIDLAPVCLGVAALPFAAGLVLAPHGLEPFPMDHIGTRLLDSAALFALCLATSLYLSTRSALCTNRKFLVGLSFITYVALLTIRGPIGFYGDLIFQTEHIAGNDALMGDLIFCSFVGLLLALAVNRRLRRNARSSKAGAGEGGASP